MTSSALNRASAPAEAAGAAPGEGAGRGADAQAAELAPLVVVHGPEHDLRQLADGLTGEAAGGAFALHDLAALPPAWRLGAPGERAEQAIAELDRRIAAVRARDLRPARAGRADCERMLRERGGADAAVVELAELVEQLDEAVDDLDGADTELAAVDRQLARLERLSLASDGGGSPAAPPADEAAPGAGEGDRPRPGHAATRQAELEASLHAANRELEAAAAEAQQIGKALARYEGLASRSELLDERERLGELRDALDDLADARTAQAAADAEAAAAPRPRRPPPWLQSAALGMAGSLIVLAVGLLVAGATTVGAGVALVAVAFAAAALVAPAPTAAGAAPSVAAADGPARAPVEELEGDVARLAVGLRLPPEPSAAELERRELELRSSLDARRDADALVADLAAAQARFVDADEQRSRVTSWLMDDDVAGQLDEADDDLDGVDTRGDDVGEGAEAAAAAADDQGAAVADDLRALWRRQRDELVHRRDELAASRAALAERRQRLAAELAARLDDPTGTHLVQARQAAIDVLAWHRRELDRLELARWLLAGASPARVLERASALAAAAGDGQVQRIELVGSEPVVAGPAGRRPITPAAGDDVVRACLHLALAEHDDGPTLLLGLGLPADDVAAGVLASAIAGLADRVAVVVMTADGGTAARVAASRADSHRLDLRP